MNDQSDLPSVSMANTKKELLDAYEEAKKRFDSLNKDLLDAEKARKRMEKQLATATADAQAAQDPVARLHDLRGAISRELGDLAERVEGEKNVLVGKIEALEKMVASQAALIADLSKKSDMAYEKVQDIANRAVTAARRENYAPPAQPVGVSARDEKQS